MIEAEQSLSPSALHRAFYGPSELRAGWRLFVFLAIVIALINAGNLIVRGVLHGADDTTLFLVREMMDFLIFLLANWIMGRIEGRTIADYGLPGRRMFRVRFWQGVLLGFASITGLLVAMRVVGVFYFGSIALHGTDIWKWPSFTRSFSPWSLCEKSSAPADKVYSLSRRASASGQPQFSRPHFSATLTTGTLARIGSDCLTRERLDCWLASCCAEPAISGCRSGSTWPSTGAKRTFIVSPTAVKPCPVTF
jgi:hypothetical protein